jgi:hypothetical protein
MARFNRSRNIVDNLENMFNIDETLNWGGGGVAIVGSNPCKILNNF